MGCYLITGRGGTGKTTICAELKRRGYPAFDADKVAGLSRWEDRKTRHPVKVDESGFVDFKKVSWNWDPVVLNELLTSHKFMILCGSASNQDEFHDRFDRIFVLMPNRENHRQRLQTRQSDYGKRPAMTEYLLDEHLAFAKTLTQSGGIPINADSTPSETVDLILKSIDDNRKMA